MPSDGPPLPTVSGPALREAKFALRTRCLARRDALPAQEHAAASAAIAAGIAGIDSWVQAPAVLVTLPFGSEWNTRPLVDAALAAGKAVVLPRVNPRTRMLDLFAIRDPESDVERLCIPDAQVVSRRRGGAGCRRLRCPRRAAGLRRQFYACCRRAGGCRGSRRRRAVDSRARGSTRAVRHSTCAAAAADDMVRAPGRNLTLAIQVFSARRHATRCHPESCAHLPQTDPRVRRRSNGRHGRQPRQRRLSTLRRDTGVADLRAGCALGLARRLGFRRWRAGADHGGANRPVAGARGAAPRSRMALPFSLKQTGVPAGAPLAGATLPPLALALGWRPTLLLVTALGALVIVAAQPTRRLLDADRLPARPLSVRGVLAPLRAVFASRALAELSLAGFTYAATQVCLMSFLVVYLTETLGRSLVAAGLALTVANLGGIVGRIGWGAIADRRIPPRRLLGLLGILSCLCAVATAAFDARWSPGVLLALCATFGATAIGWNGVQLAELARHAPRGQEGAITGASGFLTLSGVVVGPPTFALLASLTGSYRVGFTVFGIASGLCGAYFLLSGREAMPAAGR
jgi:hypothetical protein